MSWLFWVLAAALTMAALAPLGRALLRASRETPARPAYDLAVYRDQLAEIDRERALGTLGDGEAEAVRREVQRRILQAAEPSRPVPIPARPLGASGAARVVAALVSAVPAGSLALYLGFGSPDVPSLPLAQRAEEVAQLRESERLAAELREHLEAQTEDDPRGWGILGRTYMGLGRYIQAAYAFRRAVVAGGDGADLHATLGEALVASSDGTVTPEARASFERALARAPAQPRARYYLALARAQGGYAEEALEAWVRLARETPEEVPWRGRLIARIALTAESLDLDPGALDTVPRPATVPGPVEAEAFGQMSEAEREVFVRGMVERLAARLEAEPDDLDGWLRLARARLVLGERREAMAALREAGRLAAHLPDDDPLRRTVEEALDALDPSS